MAINTRRKASAYGLNGGNGSRGGNTFLAPIPIQKEDNKAPVDGVDIAQDGQLLILANGTVYIFTEGGGWQTATGISGAISGTSLVINPGNATITAGDLAVTAGDFSVGGNTTLTGDITVHGTTNIDGQLAFSSASAVSVITTDNVDPAILLEANGGSSEAIQIYSLQGTAADAIDIQAQAGGVNMLAGGAAMLLQTTNQTASIVTGTGTLNLGADLVAHTINIGNVTGATAVTVSAGTGNLALISTGTWTGTSTGNMALNSTGGTLGFGTDNNTGAVTLGGGTGGRTISIGAGAGAINTIAIGGTGANVITIADAQTGGSIAIGAAMTTGTIAIGGTGLQTGTITIGGGTGAQTVNLATGGTGIKTVNIANGSAANVVNVANTQTGGSYTLGDAMTTGTINLGGTGAQTGTMTIAGGTGAQSINIANSTGGKTVAIATGAGANVVSLGSSNGASSLTLKAGTGNFSLDGAATSTYTFAPSTTSGTINFGGTGANTGTMTIAGGTGVQAVNIANSTGVKTVSIAGGAAANVVSVGTTNTTASLALKSGTGGLSLTGGQVLPVTNVNNAASPYTLLGSDQFVAVDPTAGVVTVTLPAVPATGRFITVYDATGQAAAHTITVDGNGKNISAGGSAAATATLTTAYSSLNLWYNGTIWNAQAIV